MKIQVEMTSEEFQEFMEFRKENDIYRKQLAKIRTNGDALADKVLLAVEPDPQKEGMCMVANEDHLAELYDMALDW